VNTGAIAAIVFVAVCAARQWLNKALLYVLTSWEREALGLTVPRGGPCWPAVLCALENALGQLVPLGFDISAFTPAAYQRHRL
jgi:hypothetical protein